MIKIAHGLSVVATATTALLLAATQVSATAQYDDFVQWQRSCGTDYAGTVTKKKAVTGKATNGSCAGHAWLGVKYKNGRWSNWKHDATEAVIKSRGGNIVKAVHKGCADCKKYYTEP
ncbi:hypothetical protein [Streptomyces longispororuber]|uniref:hypothetical protein n=1 Tax=Streptomyces longispororuber TaxID=68230 RepID=UPI00210B4D2C|nr:hypothetical protein [Streptomyces longispororuber]MCQ4211524.1 hypothetical protein [Streptomyces longispororuber]